MRLVLELEATMSTFRVWQDEYGVLYYDTEDGLVSGTKHQVCVALTDWGNYGAGTFIAGMSDMEMTRGLTTILAL